MGGAAGVEDHWTESPSPAVVRHHRAHTVRETRCPPQDRLKELPCPITYSYWDGHGHRREVLMKQGNTIETFLRAVQKDFPELAGTSTSDLLYIKEDLIIPANYTFYELVRASNPRRSLV